MSDVRRNDYQRNQHYKTQNYGDKVPKHYNTYEELQNDNKDFLEPLQRLKNMGQEIEKAVSASSNVNDSEMKDQDRNEQMQNKESDDISNNEGENGESKQD